MTPTTTAALMAAHTISRTSEGFDRVGVVHATYREALHAGRSCPTTFVDANGSRGRIHVDGSATMDDGRILDKYGVTIPVDGSYTCEFCSGTGTERAPRRDVDQRLSFITQPCSQCAATGRLGVRS